MKENDQSRYIRWGIPGWMMFISLIGFWIIDVLFTHDSNQNEIYLLLQNKVMNIGMTSSASAAILALVVAAAGVPLGFLIYQFYFYIRWNSPFSRDGFFPPFVVGRWQDLERTMDGIDYKQVSEGKSWRDKWTSDPEFTHDHGGRWRYIENYFIEVLQKLMLDSNEIDLYSRYRYLLELLHTLGAGLFGVYLGYAGYLMTKVKLDSFSLSVMLLICASCLTLLILFIEIEDKLRKAVKKGNVELPSMESAIVILLGRIPWVRYINLSVIYLFFLGDFLYLGSPSPSPLAPIYRRILFRIIILIVPLLVWILTSHRTILKLRISETVLLLLVGVSAAFLSLWARNYLTSEHWAFGWATFAFMIINAIFIKNRQNTRDDLIALQNYTLKRYIFSGDQEPRGGAPVDRAEAASNTGPRKELGAGRRHRQRRAE
jgi:hypothetical protein